MPTSAPAATLAEALDLAGLWVSPLAWMRLLENWRDRVDAEVRLDKLNVDLDVLDRKRHSALIAIKGIDFTLETEDLDRSEAARLYRDQRDVQKAVLALDTLLAEVHTSREGTETALEATCQSIADHEGKLRRLRSLLRETAPDLTVPDYPRGFLERDELTAASTRLADMMRTLYAALFEQRRVELAGSSGDCRTPPPTAGGPVFDDCSSFRWGDRLFQFHRPREREAVRRLWQAHQANGNPDGLPAETVLGCVGETRRKGRRKVRDLFKHPKRGMNPAWGTLIVSVPDKHERRIKRYRLNLTG